MRPLLILRPEPGATSTAIRARRMGLDPLIQPLFRVDPLPWTAADAASFDAVMMTSANAARHGGDGLRAFRAMPLYAVGEATADAARLMGFEQVIDGGHDVASLASVIARDGRRHVLHLAGDHVTPFDAGAVNVTRIEVYRTVDLQPDDLGPALLRSPVAMLHSARAAARFAGLAAIRDPIAVVAISPKVAEAAGSGWQSIHAAPVPDDAAMLAIAAALCHQAADNRDAPR